MRVERQVVGQQVDVVGQQGFQALAADAGDAAILAFPEIAVMHEDGIGPARHGDVEQRLAGGDAGDDAHDLGASFHLQAVWAIIAELRGLQQPVQIVHQFVHVSSIRSFMRRLWLIFAQTVTVAVAILFVTSTLKPEWLPAPAGVR